MRTSWHDRPRIPGLPFVAAVSLLMASLCGCGSSAEIRIQNLSTLDYREVGLGDQDYGHIAAGATSEYKTVQLRFRYAVLSMTADGHRLTGQTLNLGAKRFTYRIKVEDLAAGHLAIEVVRD